MDFDVSLSLKPSISSQSHEQLVNFVRMKLTQQTSMAETRLNQPNEHQTPKEMKMKLTKEMRIKDQIQNT